MYTREGCALHKARAQFSSCVRTSLKTTVSVCVFVISHMDSLTSNRVKTVKEKDTSHRQCLFKHFTATGRGH